VENHFPETQVKDCSTLPEKYNNHVLGKWRKICEAVVEYEFVISQV
jgi:hypothetical protein